MRKERFSKLYIRTMLDNCPDIVKLNNLPDDISWAKPPEIIKSCEYGFHDFFDEFCMERLKYEYEKFWPAKGPRWDALGHSNKNLILVEAKAYPNESLGKMGATSSSSICLINQSLKSVSNSLGGSEVGNWTGKYYQFANRIAHLWFLRENGNDAHLIYVSFIDHTNSGRKPKLRHEWDFHYEAVYETLGISKDNLLSDYIHFLFVEVRETNGALEFKLV